VTWLNIADIAQVVSPDVFGKTFVWVATVAVVLPLLSWYRNLSKHFVLKGIGTTLLGLVPPAFVLFTVYAYNIESEQINSFFRSAIAPLTSMLGPWLAELVFFSRFIGVWLAGYLSALVIFYRYDYKVLRNTSWVQDESERWQ
jgi:hypothetical protein